MMWNHVKEFLITKIENLAIILNVFYSSLIGIFIGVQMRLYVF